MQESVYMLLNDGDIRRTFDMIATRRTISLKDLRDALGAAPGKPAVETLSELLDRLKAAHLIQEQANAPMEDFRTFFVTEEGLSAERELRRVQVR